MVKSLSHVADWMQSVRARAAMPLRLLALALFIFITSGPAAIAENDGSPLQFWLQQRRVFQPVRPPPQPDAQRRRVRPPRAAQRPAPAPGALPDGGVVVPVFTTIVIGDSLGVLLAQGLQAAFADRPEMAFLRRARESSGLVRVDFYNWGKAAEDMLAAPDKPDLAIMMIGSNDHQPIRDGADYVEPLTPRWREIYGDRVEALAAQFRARNVPLIWVGMPVMKNDRMAADMIQFNEVFRERAGKAGAFYIDLWGAFLNDANKFDTFGPDVNGMVTRLRSADGVHFTKAGARKLAHFVEADVKRAFELALPKSDPGLAALLPAGPAPTHADSGPATLQPSPASADAGDINVILRRQLGLEPANAALDKTIGLQAALPLSAERASLFFPVRPAAGPVLKLTGPLLAASDQLAGATPAGAVQGAAQEAIDQTFAGGHLPRAKPGRADYFGWPR